MPRQLELGRKLPRHRGVFIQGLDRLDGPRRLVAVATPGGRSGPRASRPVTRCAERLLLKDGVEGTPRAG